MGFFQKIFGGSSKSQRIKEMLDRGGVVIDVRTPGEFASGHVPGSKNIPLNNLNQRLPEIKKINKPLVLCCASGMRSAQANAMLSKQGLECMNGGSWGSVKAAVQR